jgi:adenylate cyclase
MSAVKNIRHFWKSHKLHFNIITAFLALLIGSNALIIGYSYFTNRAAIMNFSRDIMTQISQKSIAQSTAYLESAKKVTVLSQRMITRPEEIDMESNPKLYEYLANVVAEYSHIDSVYAGSEKGDFLYVEMIRPGRDYFFKNDVSKRLPGNVKFIVQTIKRSVSEPIQTYYYLDVYKRVLLKETLTKFDYDHRSREWYMKVAQSRNFNWSGIYIFAIYNIPGITASAQLTGRDSVGDSFFGVIGADLTLGDYSKFLAASQISEQSLVFIFNGDGEVIAHPDPKKGLLIQGSDIKAQMVQGMDRKEVVRAYELFSQKKDPLIIFEYEGVEYIGSFTRFPDDFPYEWYLCIVAPSDEFVGVINQSYQNNLMMAIIIMLFSAFFIYYLSRRISQPIVFLSQEIKRLQNFDMSGNLNFTSNVSEIQSIRDAMAALKRSLTSFGKFMPKTLVQKLISKGVDIKLGGKEKELSLFFSDIVSFTSISESMGAEKLALHLSEYLTELSHIIMETGGTIDKYIGDAIMAFWGAPVNDPNHAFNACHTALMCQKRLVELNRKWTMEGKPVFLTRIGLHAQNVIVGNIGSEERMNYTVLGDGVNLAARLEGVNKLYGTNIMASGVMYEKLKTKFLFRPVDVVAVKGKNESVIIYELLAQLVDEPSLLPSEHIQELANATSKAFKVYLEQRWDEALEYIEGGLKKAPEDTVLNLLADRCRHFKAKPPGDKWDGSVHLTTK